MATALNYTTPISNEVYRAQAEKTLCKLNEAFQTMTNTSFHEEYEYCKVEVSRLKIEIYTYGFGLQRDVTGWRLA